MSKFDFTALIKFLGALFDAIVALASKLGFSLNIGGGEEASEDAAE